MMDTRLISYLYFFNVKQDYYECHEYGEHLWLAEGRPIVLKGLIQAAVCLYHLYNGNVRGGHAMWLRARAYVHDARPNYQGINLDALTRDIDAVFARVPPAYHGQIVAVEKIQALQLPEVYIQITDPEVAACLDTWQPPALDDAD